MHCLYWWRCCFLSIFVALTDCFPCLWSGRGDPCMASICRKWTVFTCRAHVLPSASFLLLSMLAVSWQTLDALFQSYSETHISIQSHAGSLCFKEEQMTSATFCSKTHSKGLQFLRWSKVIHLDASLSSCLFSYFYLKWSNKNRFSGLLRSVSELLF